MLGHNLANRGDHALLSIAVAVRQTKKLDTFVRVDQTAQSDTVDGHLVGGVPVHLGSELHPEAERGVATNICYDLDVLTEELVYRSVLLHNFQDAIDEAGLLPRAFQMPHQLMDVSIYL